MSKIEMPKMSEILKEEFMEPLGISASRLANDIGVSISRIQGILHDKRRITADTSIRLGRYFGVSSRYFIDIQSGIDIRNVEPNIHNEISKIAPVAL